LADQPLKVWRQFLVLVAVEQELRQQDDSLE
jgi:hypothetical protein